MDVRGLKKLVIIALCIVAIIVGLFIYNDSKILKGTDDLIAKAREVIPVAESDTIDIAYAVTLGIDEEVIIWFISGNEYQNHYYLPTECVSVGGNISHYKYIRTYKPLERVNDIAQIFWNRTYVFLINNEECQTIQFNESNGSVVTKDVEHVTTKDGVEYIYPSIISYQSETGTFEYIFLDSDGNEIR